MGGKIYLKLYLCYFWGLESHHMPCLSVDILYTFSIMINQSPL